MELTLDPVGGAWLVYALAALLLAAPWVAPPRAGGLSRERRRTLQVLRTLATLALLFAWARPTLVRVKSESLRPTLVMLLDASRSMTVADALDGASRWDAARRMLDAASQPLARLAEKIDLRAYVFDRDARPLTLEGGRLTLPGAPTGDETALGAALAAALDGGRGEGSDALAGVVVISDGAQRARPPRDTPPLALAARLAAEGAALYAVAVGERAAGDRPGVAIDDLVVSDAAFAGAPLEAVATLRVVGFPNRRVRVRMAWENERGELEPVDAAQVDVRQGVELYPVALRHTPEIPGEWKLSVAADTLDGEAVAEDNEASTFVTVRAGGVRVLYLTGATRTGGASGVEQRFVRASLAASPDIVVERVAIDYRESPLDLARRFAPGSVDVVFLDNIDADGLTRGAWRALTELVAAGGGLAMTGGRQSFGPGGHRDTLGDILPINLGRAERQLRDAPPREDVHLAGPLELIPRGTHPIIDVAGEDGGPVWPRLPTLDGANRLGADLKPTAEVLLTSGGDAPQPLLVVGPAGLGRALAFAGDSTWRWVLAGEGEAHKRFWRQVVLWLARKGEDPDATVFIDLAARRVPAGARLDVAAGVRFPNPPADAAPAAVRYEAAVELPAGGRVPLPLTGSGSRAAGVFTDTSAPGDYRVVVRALDGDAPLGEATARFHVPRRDLELERPGAEPDTLSRLAKATEPAGGRTLALEELPALFAELAAKKPEERREVVARTTLYDKWPLLAVFAGLMTAEWLVRRGAGMP